MSPECNLSIGTENINRPDDTAVNSLNKLFDWLVDRIPVGLRQWDMIGCQRGDPIRALFLFEIAR